MPGGAFVAIEGGDGAGKGTAIAALCAALRARGFNVLSTREPGGTPEGLALRELLLRPRPAWEPWAELLLMTAARVQHVGRVIRPAIASGTVVISDRFVGSTIAYQGAGHGLPVASIERLHREACADFWPGLTVVLDIDPAIGLLRARRRLQADNSGEDRFEQFDLAFHERVRHSFLAQARDSPRRHAIVDGARPPAEVAEAALQAVLAWLDPPTS